MSDLQYEPLISGQTLEERNSAPLFSTKDEQEPAAMLDVPQTRNYFTSSTTDIRPQCKSQVNFGTVPYEDT